MDIKDLELKLRKLILRMYFTCFSRFDMNRYFTSKVYEDERIVYEN